MNSGETLPKGRMRFVFTEVLLQAEPTATLPKPNLGELSRQILSPGSKIFHVEKSVSRIA
jgi:hypothetical protein